jgi:hypothetical protein
MASKEPQVKGNLKARLKETYKFKAIKAVPAHVFAKKSEDTVAIAPTELFLQQFVKSGIRSAVVFTYRGAKGNSIYTSLKKTIGKMETSGSLKKGQMVVTTVHNKAYITNNAVAETDSK